MILRGDKGNNFLFCFCLNFALNFFAKLLFKEFYQKIGMAWQNGSENYREPLGRFLAISHCKHSRVWSPGLKPLRKAFKKFWSPVFLSSQCSLKVKPLAKDQFQLITIFIEDRLLEISYC